MCYDYLTVNYRQLFVKVCVPINVKTVAHENIIIAKFKIWEVMMSAHECGILGSKPRASHTFQEVSHIWTRSVHCKFRNVCENFIFTNSVKDIFAMLKICA